MGGVFLTVKEKIFHLAVDIGASSGRHILGYLEDGKLITREIYRFENCPVNRNGSLIWDVDALFRHILEGMKKCAREGSVPSTVSIDTWGVDHVLLDKNGERITDAFCYRDSRTDGIPEAVEKIISQDELYRRTGIQKQKFNTIFQLCSLLRDDPGVLEKAQTMLLLPDYFNYLLTGKKSTEYTNASTTGLLNAESCSWDIELIEKLGLPLRIFTPISEPGTFLGKVLPEIEKIIGYAPDVCMTTSHDTASAILAVPGSCDKRFAYISSGTWSLIGTELERPEVSESSMKSNLTNEGGYGHRYRYLKNITGLWMIQRLKAEEAPDMSFGEFAGLASGRDTEGLIDVNDERFLSPENMLREIGSYLEETGQRAAKDVFDAASMVYRSLARFYSEGLKEIEMILGTEFDEINIVGGGSNADFLNALTAKCSGKKVMAGPSECTAIGNMLAVMLACGEIPSLKEARETVKRSFVVKEYV